MICETSSWGSESKYSLTLYHIYISVAHEAKAFYRHTEKSRNFYFPTVLFRVYLYIWIFMFVCHIHVIELKALWKVHNFIQWINEEWIFFNQAREKFGRYNDEQCVVFTFKNLAIYYFFSILYILHAMYVIGAQNKWSNKWILC